MDTTPVETPIDREAVRQNRLQLLRETRKIYYDENWKPLPTRAVNVIDGGCYYKMSDGRRCAIGRIWEEFSDPVQSEQHCGVGHMRNSTLLLHLSKRDGYHCGDDKNTLTWFEQLQYLHDNLSGEVLADLYEQLEATA